MPFEQTEYIPPPAVEGSTVERFGKGLVRSVPGARTLARALGSEALEDQPDDTAGYVGELVGDLAMFVPALRIAKLAGMSAAALLGRSGSKAVQLAGRVAGSRPGQVIGAGAALEGTKDVERGGSFVHGAAMGGLIFGAFEGLGLVVKSIRRLRASEALARSARTIDEVQAVESAVKPPPTPATPTARVGEETLGFPTRPGVQLDPAMRVAERPQPRVLSAAEQDALVEQFNKAPADLVGIPSGGSREVTPRIASAARLSEAGLPDYEAGTISRAIEAPGEAMYDMVKPNMAPPAPKPNVTTYLAEAVHPDAVLEMEEATRTVRLSRNAPNWLKSAWTAGERETPLTGKEPAGAIFLVNEKGATEWLRGARKRVVPKAGEAVVERTEQGWRVLRSKGLGEGGKTLEKLKPTLDKIIPSGGSTTPEEEALFRKAFGTSDEPLAAATSAEDKAVNAQINALEAQQVLTTDAAQGHDLTALLARFVQSGRSFSKDFLGRLGFAPSHPAARVAHYGNSWRALRIEAFGEERQLVRLAGGSTDVLEREAYDLLRGAKPVSEVSPAAQAVAEADRQMKAGWLERAMATGVIGEAVVNYVKRTVKESGEETARKISVKAREWAGLGPDKIEALAKRFGVDAAWLNELVGELSGVEAKQLGQPFAGKALSTTRPEGIHRVLTEAGFDKFVAEVGLTRETNVSALHRAWKESVGGAVLRSELLHDLGQWADPKTGQRLLMPYKSLTLHPEWKAQYTVPTGQAGQRKLWLTIDGEPWVARNDVAELLSRVIPQEGGGSFYQMMDSLQVGLKRIFMWHPWFHANNFGRNLVAASLGDPGRLFKFMGEFAKESFGSGGEGRKLWQAFLDGKSLVEFGGKAVHPAEYLDTASKAGLNLLGMDELAVDLLHVAKNADPGLLRTVDQWMAKKLWGDLGRNLQLVVWENLRARLFSEGAERTVADRVAAKKVNDLFGTINRETITNLSESIGTWTWFARRWTHSNWNHLKALGGLVDPSFSEPERKLIQEIYWRSTAAGLAYMFAVPQVINVAVTGHPSFMNEVGKRNDIAYWKDPETGRVFYLNTLGFIKDFLTLLTNERGEFNPIAGSTRFVSNKMSPLARIAGETISGRSALTGRSLVLPGATMTEQALAMGERAVSTLTAQLPERLYGSTPTELVRAAARATGLPEPPPSMLRQDPMRSRMTGKETAATAVGLAAGFFTGVGRTVEEQHRNMQFNVRDLSHERNIALERGDIHRANRLQQKIADMVRQTSSDIDQQLRQMY